MAIDNELYRLAEGIEVPVVDPADDLARGRTRLRRRRAGVGGAAVASLAVAAVIGGMALAGGGGGSADDEPGFAGTPEASELSGSEAVEQVRERHAEEPGPVDPPDTIDAALMTYRTVLAEHLDPSGEHLQQRPDNEQSGGGGSQGDYLGTKLGWSVPGDDGLGMVQVGVANSRAALDGWWACGPLADDPAWTCGAEQQVGDTGDRAWVARQGDKVQVVVEQGGTWVLLNVDPLFGNNSLTPVASLSFPEEDLIEVGRDRRIQLPEGYDPQLEH